jgi:hypothetical protein
VQVGLVPRRHRGRRRPAFQPVAVIAIDHTSIAVTLYPMLCGKLPFEGESTALPPALTTFLQRSLATKVETQVDIQL